MRKNFIVRTISSPRRADNRKGLLVTVLLPKMSCPAGEPFRIISDPCHVTTRPNVRKSRGGRIMRHIKSINLAKRIGSLVLILLSLVTFLIGLAAPKLSAQAPNGPNAIPVISPGSAYRLQTLLSDMPGVAPVLDPLLVNPWASRRPHRV